MRNFLAVLALCASAGCASNLVKSPPTLQVAAPIAHAQDDRFVVFLDRVLVRNDKDVWVVQADWDQYFLRVSSRGGGIEVREVRLIDATGAAMSPSADRDALVEGMRAREQRYQVARSEVGSPTGKAALVGGAGSAAVAGVAGYSAWAAGAVLGAVFVAPAVVGGLIYGATAANRIADNSRIAAEIQRRASVLPVAIAAGGGASLSLFYPMTPLPVRMEVDYVHDGEPHKVVMDLREALAKPPVSEPAPRLLSRQEPLFPVAALRDGVRDGHVRARLSIASGGSVEAVTILESRPPGVFDREAATTFRTWRYSRSVVSRESREAEETMRFHVPQAR